MRGLLLLLAIALAGGSAWGVIQVTPDDFGHSDIVCTVDMKIEKHRVEVAAKPALTEEPVLDECMVWGGFPLGDLVRVRLHLKKQNLEDKVVIQDRFGPDRFIVYLGPYDNQTAVRAFVKQFRQQGYKTVRPILSGELSYGVEIASFKTRMDAEAFLTGKRAPNMTGIKITNRLGEPTGMVDLVFNHINATEKTKLEALRSLYPRTVLATCSRLANEEMLNLGALSQH